LNPGEESTRKDNAMNQRRGSQSLLHARAESWMHYHASTQIPHAIVLKQDNQTYAMLEDSIRNTDILIGQLKIDPALTNQ